MRPVRLSRRKRIVIASVSAGMALLLVAVAGYVLLGHFNANIQQDNISALLGNNRPVDTRPQAENILVIGSDSRNGLGGQYGKNLVTDQSDTMMIIHIPADRQWAEVMSIPRDSWVNIPACAMGNGQLSSPHQFKINEAFAIGNLDGNHTALGVACTVKTVEQDTGIFIDHFVVVNFTGFKSMVAALGGVEECNSTPINDPLSHLHLSAGHHLLTPVQALEYVRARYTLGDGSDLERIGRQQAFMSSLVSRVKSQLLNPLAIYRFLDAATKSLTIDSQLGGITGLYNLGESLRGIPSDKIAFFTVPNYPRGDGANVLWTQPEDNAIFRTFRDDVPASPSLFRQPAGAVPTATSTGAASSASASGATSPAATLGPTPSPASSPDATAATSPAASPAASPGSSPSPSLSGSPSGPPPSLQARTANQNICGGLASAQRPSGMQFRPVCVGHPILLGPRRIIRRECGPRQGLN